VLAAVVASLAAFAVVAAVSVLVLLLPAERGVVGRALRPVSVQLLVVSSSAGFFLPLACEPLLVEPSAVGLFPPLVFWQLLAVDVGHPLALSESASLALLAVEFVEVYAEIVVAASVVVYEETAVAVVDGPLRHEHVLPLGDARLLREPSGWPPVGEP
jgi:predicted short-subunit dehydrogenase-like oxidoreductase (DUF2520 family)